MFSLLASFLDLPILDDYGRDRSYPPGVGIPAAGALSACLLNFVLDDLDREFTRAFPGVSYMRYAHESFISIPCSSSFEVSTLEGLLRDNEI